MDSARPTPPLRGGDGETVSWTRPGSLTSHFSPGPTATPMRAPRAAPTRPTPPALAGSTTVVASRVSQSCTDAEAHERADPRGSSPSAPLRTDFEPRDVAAGYLDDLRRTLPPKLERRFLEGHQASGQRLAGEGWSCDSNASGPGRCPARVRRCRSAPNGCQAREDECAAGHACS